MAERLRGCEGLAQSDYGSEVDARRSELLIGGFGNAFEAAELFEESFAPDLADPGYLVQF